MDNYENEPEIYNIMFYLLIFVGFYIFYKVFTLNEPENEDDKTNEHSS